MNHQHLFRVRLWHIYDSHGQILALAFRQKSLKPCEVFPLRSEADSGFRRNPPSYPSTSGRRGNHLTGFKDFYLKNGSSQGQNLAMTALYVTS